MVPDEAQALRMELAEYLSSHIDGDGAHELFELAAADTEMFFAELQSRHRSGELVLPRHLLKAIARDFGNGFGGNRAGEPWRSRARG